MIRQFYVWGEEVKRSMNWLIKHLIKVGARVSYHDRRWYVYVASAFPLAHHYRAVLGWAPYAAQQRGVWVLRVWCTQNSGIDYSNSEIYGTMPPMRGVGLRNVTFGRFSPKQRGPQDHFSTAGPRRPHNLGLGEEFF